MDEFMKVRDEHDPEGMFLGEWHHRVLPVAESKALGEREKGRRKMGRGFGDSVEWTGLEGKAPAAAESEQENGPLAQVLKQAKDHGGLHTERDTDSPSPPATATSEESFDYLAKGEASVHE
jgi:D-arabinono-1,4-lactone oxidase